ncbi:hypothetical protein QIS96_07385 [Streptomyces sp. B-S-A6]|uniref:Uncharacterized protein n=2 Tax=Streptomyces cavernicola TaxID=3043613 RepID=A0ABT6S6C6_9ACTN|nr:hypothetical protein [Streptomyces sp. B-S-A6]MDI3403647.1 hypothetical protein [Streptomyces sp. B-S-A6]
MTDEVGVVTGELTVAVEELPGGAVGVTVQYVGAEEWYTVSGSPVPAGGLLAGVFEEVVARVRRGGGATVSG